MTESCSVLWRCRAELLDVASECVQHETTLVLWLLECAEVLVYCTFYSTVVDITIPHNKIENIQF